jgi:2,3-diaminopropionate biosynthesis protein SbnA
VSIISAPQEYNEEDLFIDLAPVFQRRLYLKCEGFNFAGSIKLKAASEMVATAERDGTLKPDSILIESSSGNLGIALSVIAANRGYRFVCVTDARSSPAVVRTMEAFGSSVHMITEPDLEGGFLGARLRYVRELCAGDPRYVWLNQYTNPSNWMAHYRMTGPAIAKNFPELDVLFVGAGTTGTLMGCARYFREHAPRVKVVAVDSVGSVAFGGPPGTRMIPGLGTGVLPPMLDLSYLDDFIYIPEPDTVRACHRLVRAGYLLGGSTGTVISGANAWLDKHDPAGQLTSVAISPDLGEKYLESLYQHSWLRETYGDSLLDIHGQDAVGSELSAAAFA